MSDREELEKLRRLHELELKAGGRTFGEAAREVADEVGNVAAGGTRRALTGVLGLPATLINLVTQGSPKLMNALGVKAAPLVPRMVGEPQDWDRLLETIAGEPAPTAKTKAGKVAESMLAAALGSKLTGGGLTIGAISGGLGEATTQATDNPHLGAAAATLPYLTKGAWQAFRPMRAEHTARDILRNVTPDEMDETFKRIKDFKTRSGGTAEMIPAQALPPHSQAPGLAVDLARTTEGKPIVDALVKQGRPLPGGKSPVDLMRGSYQDEAAKLYAQGEAVRPTRAGVQALWTDLRGLPKELGVPANSDQAALLTKALAETRDVLRGRPNARQLSVYADSLAAKKDYIPGAGPYFPAAAGKVAELAKKTHPAIGQADDLIARQKELTDALNRVQIPGRMGMADVDPGAVAPNLALAAGGQATGHSLVAGAALARMARSFVAGHPEKKLAEALADPTMRKLTDLAGTTRPGGFSINALRAAIQAELQAAQAPQTPEE